MLDSLKRIFLPGGPPPGNDAAAAMRLHEQALRLAAAGELEAAAALYRDALSRKPDFPDACANLGLLLVELGRRHEAESLLRRAAQLAPGNREVAANLRMFLGGQAPAWQFPMMNDSARNAAYEKAIAKAVRPGDHVLEIGTGSGLLAMMAARCGARHVTTCERIEPLADQARKIIAHNGFGGVVSVIPELSTDLAIPGDLEDAADVLISEIVASDLIGEGILASIEDASARLLAPGARIVPARASIRGQLVGSPEIERYLRVGSVAGFNLEAFNEFSPTTLLPDDLGVALDAYSEPLDMFEFDFAAQRSFPSERKRLAATVTRDGRCHGVLQWIRLQLFDDVEIENSAPAAGDGIGRGHWKRTLHAFAQPLDVKVGQSLGFAVAHNRRNLVIYADG